MALKSSFVWKNPDSTADLNDRNRQLVARGVYFGGSVVPGAGLSVSLSPFLAMSYDGMTVTETDTVNLPVADGQVNVVVTRARYNPFGTPAVPTLIHQVLEEGAYNADAEKNYLIVHAKVDVPALAATVAAGDIDFTEADHVDPVDRKIFRGTVPNAASLPNPASPTNRIGDFYYVTTDNTFYVWDGSTWNALSTGSFNSEVSHMNDTQVQAEMRRVTEGSGVLAGIRQTTLGDYSSSTGVTVIEQPSVADQVAIDSFEALVNGFYVQVHAQAVSLPTKPGVGERLDMVFLEVWREESVSPQTETYDRAPDGTLTYDIDEIDTQGAEILWTNGLAGNNFNLPEIEARAHDWVITRWRISVTENIGPVGLYQPSDSAITTASTNIDGNFFDASAGVDTRVWIGDAGVTSIEGKSWAIPLFVIRRTSLENSGIGDAVKIFRSGIRHIMPVYPVCDISVAGREVLRTLEQKEVGSPYTTVEPFDQPSGFLNSVQDFPIATGAGANSIQLYDELMHIRFRGFEDWIDPLTGGEVDLGTPPGASYTRQFVYLKMSLTLQDDARADSHVSAIHRPYIKSQTGGSNVENMGWRQGYVTYEVVVSDLGATATILDADSAFTAEGWSRGDLTLTSIGKEYEDGGIWSRAVAIDVDDRIHPHLHEWAIPLCLVHRRNSSAWNYNTNPNGSTGRPDGRDDATVIHPDDLVDLRMLADTSIDLEALLEESLDKMMKGQLRTRLANKGKGQGTGGPVAGSRILQSDQITSTAPGAAFDLPQADGHRRVWSDAKEFQTISRTWDLTSDYSDSLVSWTAATGALTISAPPGAHLVRHMPPAFYVDADTASGTYLEFKGPPLWATRRFGTSPISAFPSQSSAKQYDSSTRTVFELYPLGSPEDFTVSATDTYGRATSMTHTDTNAPYASNEVAAYTWWVHYDRSLAVPYNGNYGLAEIPDTVWSATKGHHGGSPEELNIGTLYTTVRKTVVASSSVSVTSSDVLTASGVSGTTVTMMGFGTLAYDQPTPTISSQTMSNARDTLTITWTGPFTGDVDIQVFFSTDEVTEWVEIGRGGKSLRALFSWHEETIDNASVSDNPAVIDLGSSVWQDAEVSGDRVAMPMIWTRNAPAATWTLRTRDFTSEFGFHYSGLMDIDIDASTRFGDQFVLVVFPKQTAPTAAIGDDILLHYTYTPYQGLSSDGGAAPVASTAVPVIRDMTHGVIEANTDFYATQAGATSYHGGVECFTGLPARPRMGLVAQVVPGSFQEYNATDLVKTNFRGVEDLNHQSTGKAILNAAAVLRLPFPQSTLMVSGGYHNGVMDFDLDPGREGVGAGYFSLAPGYPGSTTAPLHSSIQYDQFVNGLTRLSTVGHHIESSTIPAFTYSAVETNPGDLTLGTDGVWTILGSGPKGGTFRGDIRVTRGRYVARTLMRADVDNFPPTAGSGPGVGIAIHDLLAGGQSVATPGSYLLMNSPTAVLSSIKTIAAGTLEEVFFATCPGAVLYHLQGDNISILNPSVQAQFSTAGGSVDNKLYDTLVSIEPTKNPPGTVSGLIPPTGIATDTIRVPLESANSINVLGGRYANGKTTLKGTEIKYPASWSGAVQTQLEGHIAGADHSRRGLYLGTTSSRYCMPVLVPGSGTSLQEFLTDQDDLIDVDDSGPEQVPYLPGESIFSETNKMFATFDHGGPIAYICLGTVVRPSADAFRNRAVMQVSGGPTGADITGIVQSTTTYNKSTLHGTALDAFWPLYRPVIKSNS